MNKALTVLIFLFAAIFLGKLYNGNEYHPPLYAWCSNLMINRSFHNKVDLFCWRLFPIFWRCSKSWSPSHLWGGGKTALLRQVTYKAIHLLKICKLMTFTNIQCCVTTTTVNLGMYLLLSKYNSSVPMTRHCPNSPKPFLSCPLRTLHSHECMHCVLIGLS